MLKWVRRVALGVAVAVVLGNLAIFTASRVMAVTSSAPRPAAAIEGVRHLRVVDQQLWRGSAPSREGYHSLAESGVVTVVDLRAEDGVEVDHGYARRVGLRVVSLPIRDGQSPTAAQVQRLVEAVDESEGMVFVHCGAGVGRTGAMSAAYLFATGQANASDALRDNLAVGPPSLEQIWYAATAGEDSHRPPAPVRAVSRVLDAPRRIMSILL
jgi:protein-tyrosine phosphatase